MSKVLNFSRAYLRVIAICFLPFFALGCAGISENKRMSDTLSSCPADNPTPIIVLDGTDFWVIGC